MANGQPGAPLGNRNAVKDKEFEAALRRALARKSGNWRAGLDLVASKVVDLAHSGERWAIEQLADRIDGKPAQVVDSTMTLRDERGLSDAELVAILAGEDSEGIAAPPSDPSLTH